MLAAAANTTTYLNEGELDLVQENLHCHHLLFIKDVTSSIYSSKRNVFKTETTKLSFRRVRLNGIIVAQKRLLSNSKEQEYNIWLDDGTSVIKVILSSQILKRADAEFLDISNNVTIFGQVELIDNQHVIHCGGFKVEDNDMAEIYHWLRVLQERPKKKKPSEPDQRMFYTLSSFPSPRRLMNANFLELPFREEEMNSKNIGFLWSPDHPFATSTPIRAVQESSQLINASPLRQKMVAHANNFIVEDNEFEFDEFDSAEFNELQEKEAALFLKITSQQQSHKRKLNLL